jgi:hypothetical protein
MIFMWMPSGTSLQHHMAKAHVMGLGGAIKRLARKPSLNHYEEQIMTPRQLYEWAVLKSPSVTFQYCTVEDSKEIMMQQRGVQESLEHFKVLIKYQIQTKVFSEAYVFNTTHTVHLKDEDCEVEDIRGFVTCEYDKKLWLACVLQVNDSEIQLTFFHPFGLSKSHVTFTARHFEGSSFKSANRSGSRNCSLFHIRYQ